MTENDARDLLWRFASDALEEWIAEQPWQAVPDGWTVAGELQGWQVRIEVVAAGLRVSAGAPDSLDPVVWVVTTTGKVTWGG